MNAEVYLLVDMIGCTKKVASSLLKKYGCIAHLKLVSPETIMASTHGFGEKSYQRLKAINAYNKIPAKIAPYMKFDDAEVVNCYIRKYDVESKYEHMWLVIVGPRLELISSTLVGMGEFDSCQINISRILREVLIAGGSGFIAVHNHPSGDVSPSQADLDITKKMIKASKHVGIDMVDHIIVSKDSYYSTRKEDGFLF